MTESIIKQTEIIPQAVTITNNPTYGFGDKVILARRFGKMFVVSYYFKVTIAKAKGDSICSFDIEDNFAQNFFNENVVLATGTKQLKVDVAMGANTTWSGLIVGIIG